MLKNKEKVSVLQENRGSSKSLEKVRTNLSTETT